MISADEFRTTVPPNWRPRTRLTTARLGGIIERARAFGAAPICDGALRARDRWRRTSQGPGLRSLMAHIEAYVHGYEQGLGT